MSVKGTAARQYMAIVDRAATTVGQRLVLPAEGWIATARKALGMSAAQLARRMGVTRARISQVEHSEVSGGVTIRTMETIARTMGCRFVYAIVPSEGRIENVIAAQARLKATALVEKASTHMALENQSLTDKQNRAEIERLARELAATMPADLWSDK